MGDRDEFGIPTGKHTLTCGCEMEGRALLKPCEEHKVSLSVSGPFPVKRDRAVIVIEVLNLDYEGPEPLSVVAQMVLDAVRDSGSIDHSRLKGYMAIREDAEKVLAVFDHE